MDLDDVLEDMLERMGLDDLDDIGEDLRDRLRRRGSRRGSRRDERARGRRERREVAVEQARRAVQEQTRLPGVRARLRSAALWGSAAWAGLLGSSSLAFGLSTLDGLTTLTGGDVAGIALGVAALPAVPVGLWAWRTRDRDQAQKRQAAARRAAREERTEIPADVAGDWKRLRQAQALVTDLAAQGLVQPEAVTELGATAEQLQVLLVADHRAAQLGGAPSAPLREQVADLADLLVALAVEAVEQHTETVVRAPGPATLREATDRLRSLRAARAEVEQADARGGGAMPDLAPRAAQDTPPAAPRRAAPTDRATGDDEQRPRPMPG